ncbi:UbiD family decarboxylase [Sulfidibacter corallicola]|uniref:UbiD family decarboxylase n=1 Tax=Sulfidibacter corallicola TaxID=2818388 RepID=A0A8A4TUP5_SULCO|nr:UbiD family decarboxylase [Sulfidibacter corallicola]QTD52858.1 UbiD family decarboxylase [Sulfidibacter corallicola]
MRHLTNLQSFISLLRQEGELLEIDEPLSPKLVIPEIQRRVVARKGPALLFNKVEGSPFPVATNLFGSQKRIDLAFGGDPGTFIRDLVHVAENMLPPKGLGQIWSLRHLAMKALKIGLKTHRKGPLVANRLESLTDLPALTSWPEDGGPFVTLPLVYTEHPETGKGNLGMYRVQIQGPRQAGMHIQIHRGGGNHYFAAEKKGQGLPAAVLIGGPPALTLASIAPLPEDVPELIFASLLLGKKLDIIRNKSLAEIPLVAEADFCIYGRIPPKARAPEGPFGDHYGYYSLQHDYPFLEVEHIYHRPGAIFPATVVGRPPQEDHYIALYLQELFSPLFPLVMKGVKDVFAYEESGVHSLAGAIVSERYHKEAFTCCMRVLGEGQLSLSKVLMATEAPLDLRDFRPFLEHILARCDFRTDLHILANISQDTLDYTGPEVNKGSKAVFLGLGEKKFELATEVPGSLSNPDFGEPHLFCPGVLVVKGPAYEQDREAPNRLLALPEIQKYRWVVLHDDPKDAAASDHDFLWHIFTRFEPAGDIYAKNRVVRHHVVFEAPLVIDCRMKPGYPKVLEPDGETTAAVDAVWDKLGLD